MQCPLIDPESGEDLGIDLFGFVDLVLESPSGPLVIDFKTSARSTSPPEVAHEIQLSSYAYAFRQVYGEKEHELQIRSLIKTKTPKVEVHRYPARDARHFRRLFAVIRAYLDDLHSEPVCLPAGLDLLDVRLSRNVLPRLARLRKMNHVTERSNEWRKFLD